MAKAKRTTELPYACQGCGAKCKAAADSVLGMLCLCAKCQGERYAKGLSAQSAQPNSGQQQGSAVEDNRTHPAPQGSYRGAAAPGNPAKGDPPATPQRRTTARNVRRAADPAADLGPLPPVKALTFEEVWGDV